jgi:hypothetical protein
MNTFDKWLEDFNFAANRNPGIKTPPAPQISALQVWKTTEQRACPPLAVLKDQPVELRVVAVDAIMSFLNLNIGDMQQHSNRTHY